jgi:NADH-quinone oxidoreductase subunit G
MEKETALQRLGEVPQFQMDAIVRRSPPLQKTKYAVKAVAGMNEALMAKLGVKDGDQVVVKQGKGKLKLPAKLDNRVAKGVVRVIGSHPETSALGEMMGEIEVSKA